MADAPEFESAVTETYASTQGELTLSDISAWTKLIVRAGADSAAAAALEVGFGGSRAAGDVLIGGQRPTEWILLGPSSVLVGDLAEGLDQSGHVSLIDHTHSRALFRLTGARAASVLEKMCSLDWSDAIMPDGAVVSASVAKVTCDLTRQDVDGTASYLIACDRSFAQYLFDAVLDAGSEFDIGVS